MCNANWTRSITIAAHDFRMFLFDTRFYATCAESSLRCTAVYDTLPRGSWRTGCDLCNPMSYS